MTATEILYRNTQNGLEGMIVPELAAVFPDLLEAVDETVAAPAPELAPAPLESSSPTPIESNY